MILDLFLIQVICVLIIDISGFADEIKCLISRFITNGKIETNRFVIKPFFCSLCMTWWMSLIYILIVGKLSLFSITMALLFACTSTLTKDLYYMITDTIGKIIAEVEKRVS